MSLLLGLRAIGYACTERVMTVYENYDVIAFKSCIQIFTVYVVSKSHGKRLSPVEP